MKNIVDIKNVRTAFLYKGNTELRFTYYIFRILQYPWLVRSLTKLAEAILRYRLPFRAAIRKTIFRVFCSGEDVTQAFTTIERLNKFHVKSVLDYVSEAEKTEGAFRRNKEVIHANVKRLAAEAPGNAVSIKLSGLEDSEFFRRINNLGAGRSAADEQRYYVLMERLREICAEAKKGRVVIYFDAEDRYMQDIFDHMVGQLMAEFNTERAVVYNTLQMYLTDRLDYLDALITDGVRRSYYPGVKLVRGAYVEKEREAARAAGVPSPVFSTKQETDAAFNRAVEICLLNHSRVYTCIATHNEYSTMLAIDCIRRYNITDPERVTFSQLLGMSDNLTFNLAAGGYLSSKYLPYGEVEKAIPYLIRRAEENSSVAGQVSSETKYLRQELTRRREARAGLQV
jgi:proline dehydrogenase